MISCFKLNVSMSLSLWSIREYGRKTALYKVKNFCLVNKLFIFMFFETKVVNSPSPVKHVI